MRILIAQDTDPDEQTGVADLQRAGLPADAEVVVLSVADVLPPPAPSTEDSATPAQKIHTRVEKAVAEAQQAATRAGKTISATFPSWKVRTETHTDSPAWAIIRKADEWNPDLIIVGSHRRSTLSRLMLGSVSQKVLSEARCSVRIARQTTVAHDSPPRLLIGFDASNDARATVTEVVSRHWPPGTAARVIAVFDGMMASHTPATDDPNAALDESVAAAVGPLRGAGLTVEYATLDGNPKHLLVEEAQRWTADCVFVGASGLRAANRFLLGSVSAAVAARAHCSVEVVRRR